MARTRGCARVATRRRRRLGRRRFRTRATHPVRFPHTEAARSEATARYSHRVLQKVEDQTWPISTQSQTALEPHRDGGGRAREAPRREVGRLRRRTGGRGRRRWCRSGRRRRRRGEDRVRRRSCSPPGDKKIQVIKEVRAITEARAEGGEGARRKRSQAGQGRRRKGRGREDQGADRGRRRSGRRQVAPPALRRAGTCVVRFSGAEGRIDRVPLTELLQEGEPTLERSADRILRDRSPEFARTSRRSPRILDIPNLIEIQKESFERFLQTRTSIRRSASPSGCRRCSSRCSRSGISTTPRRSSSSATCSKSRSTTCRSASSGG